MCTPVYDALQYDRRSTNHYIIILLGLSPCLLCPQAEMARLRSRFGSRAGKPPLLPPSLMKPSMLDTTDVNAIPLGQRVRALRRRCSACCSRVAIVYIQTQCTDAIALWLVVVAIVATCPVCHKMLHFTNTRGNTAMSTCNVNPPPVHERLKEPIQPTHLQFSSYPPPTHLQFPPYPPPTHLRHWTQLPAPTQFPTWSGGTRASCSTSRMTTSVASMQTRQSLGKSASQPSWSTRCSLTRRLRRPCPSHSP